ncbi:MAG: Uma2 family endonuclease [Rubricoccaceae bacterium]
MPATLTPVSLRLTPEEYFAWEETQEEKHDYVHGEVFSMSGATRTHHDIAFNVAVALRIVFRDTERSVYTSDMRVQVEPSGRYTYPDLSAVNGASEFVDAKETTLTNPALIIEVLSESTEAYDRGEKLAAYREVSTIQEIVLIRQDRRAAEVYRREGENRWSIEEIPGDGTLELASVSATVGMDEVYAGTGV